MSIKTFSPRNDPVFVFLALSIIIHAGILMGVISLTPMAKGLFSPFQRQGEPIIVDVVDLPPEDATEKSPVKKPPTHYAQRSQSVIKETYPEPSKTPKARTIPRPILVNPMPPAASAEKKGAAALPPSTGLDKGQGKGEAKPGEKAEAGGDVTGDTYREPSSGERPGARQGGVQSQSGLQGRGAARSTPARPNLFLPDERIAELEKRYEAEAPKGEVGKTLQLNTSELKYQKYLVNMKDRIQMKWEYPDIASRSGWQGKLRIDFRINKDGTVSDIKLMKSSNYPVLDDAAITALRLAAPFPPFPNDFSVEEINIRANFEYTIYDVAPVQR
ncbi:MAG: TonB family protein [Deltaproteobacteria bacterium]|nr:TonB family protein [Deltaproteobacteria bacterium]